MKNFLLIVFCLISGFAVSQMFFSTPEKPAEQLQISAPPETKPSSDSDFENQNTIIENRELKALLEAEREKVALLSDQVEELTSQLDSALAAENTERQNARFGNIYSLDLDKLLDVGFTQVDAERILELETQARDEIRALFQEPGTRSRQAAREVFLNYSDQIRQELGDFGYETYLEASGRSTSVGVAQVAENSRGATAGIQEGDQIVSYGGERVFNIFDLQSAVADGIEGETVIVELIRDDNIQALVLPRGQIGITGDSRR